MAFNLMVQGTMSNAGKSVLTAALLRIFRQDGYRAAPFKSQNMALNSFITKDGSEIGRAQAMQAEAAGIEADVRMNPVLLKPTSGEGSQVIVNGKPWADMKAREYYREKHKLIPAVMEAYRSLSEEQDIIVIEGAGSPAEINLREGDFVNMGLAEAVDAPVLLAGDIDRGGVFAQLYGTVALLREEERARVKGLVVNKFRGDKKLLDPGLERLEELCGIPVAGVVPFLALDIDEEDSLSGRLSRVERNKAVDLAVIRLPYLSNYTDFSVFERDENVSVRYVKHPFDLGNPDMIILPGTKSTISDLRWLRESGFEALIKKAVSRGALLFGICGGFQMLGEEILDPSGMEGGGKIRGMGYFPFRTRFMEEKTTRQVKGVLSRIEGPLSGMNGKTFQGYEIHMGVSGENPVVTGSDQVYGSYVHGLFDEPGISRAVIDALLTRKGLDPEAGTLISPEDYKNQQYDKLADTVRKSLDMERIYRIIRKEE